MSRQKDVLRAIANSICTNCEFPVADWFTEDFILHEPTRPGWPTGHAGARELLATFNSLAPVKLEILDMIEEGDRVAVRWQLAAACKGESMHVAMLAIYRFKDNRIAEDWGLPLQGVWP